VAERRPTSSNTPAGRKPGGPGRFSTPLSTLAQVRPWRPRHAANDNRLPARLRIARYLLLLVIAALAGLAIWLS
jgi:hypothetical protein